MGNDHVTLRSSAVFDLLAPHTPAVPVQVELRYDTRDPYAVIAAFRTGRAGWVEWVIFELNSPSGHAVFETSAHRLADFLDRTYDIVVPGGEALWMDFDDAVEHLLSNDLHG
jgi:hypothetical protein